MAVEGLIQSPNFTEIIDGRPFDRTNPPGSVPAPHQPPGHAHGSHGSRLLTRLARAPRPPRAEKPP